MFTSWAVGVMHDRVHLSDYWRVRLGKSVVTFFESEQKNKGVLG